MTFEIILFFTVLQFMIYHYLNCLQFFLSVISAVVYPLFNVRNALYTYIHSNLRQYTYVYKLLHYVGMFNDHAYISAKFTIVIVTLYHIAVVLLKKLVGLLVLKNICNRNCVVYKMEITNAFRILTIMKSVKISSMYGFLSQAHR